MMSRREKLLQLVERDPADPFLHFGLAMEWAKESQLDDALRCFDRAIELDPNYCAAYYHRGNTLANAGRVDEARQTLNRGIAAADRCGDAHSKREMIELSDRLSSP